MFLSRNILHENSGSWTKTVAEAAQKAKAAMKIAKADESRQAKKAILVSKNRLGLVESKKLAQVIKLEVEMDDDL